jgi:hypothetical protein
MVTSVSGQVGGVRRSGLVGRTNIIPAYVGAVEPAGIFARQRCRINVTVPTVSPEPAVEVSATDRYRSGARYGSRVSPRLIATDLDGTLLRSDGTLSDRAAAALRWAAAAGVPVVPATARPLRWLPVYPFLGEAPQVVFGNGAVVYDQRAAAVVARHQLAPAALAGLCDRIRAAVPAARFAVEVDDGLAMWHEPGYPLRSDLGHPAVRPAELAELVARPAVKLLVKGPGGGGAPQRGAGGASQVGPDELLAGVVEAAGPAAEPTVSAGYGLVELAAPGVSKATGLAAVAAGLGVAPAEVVAFGDMPNDLPMLRWAGHAVAVGNAHPDVLAIAHEVTGTNDEDGVATWITTRLTTDRLPAPPPPR